MSKALFLISKIKEAGNNFIISKLKESGYKDLSPSHGDILACLYKNKKIKMKEIAIKIHRTKATVTVLVDKLEKMGLVIREKSNYDTRVVYLSLTLKGLELKPIFEKISNELNSFLYKNFSSQDIFQLENLLEKMLKNI